MRRWAALSCLLFAAVACEQTTEPDGALIEASAAELGVTSRSNTTSFRLASWGDSYPGSPDNWFQYTLSVTVEKSGPTTERSLWVQLYGDPTPYCSDRVELMQEQVGGSMNRAWVRAETECGLVDLTWERDSEVFNFQLDGWTGATENCSPPAGETSEHQVYSSRQVNAVVHGAIGDLPVPQTADDLTAANITRATSTRTECGG